MIKNVLNSFRKNQVPNSISTQSSSSQINPGLQEGASGIMGSMLPLKNVVNFKTIAFIETNPNPGQGIHYKNNQVKTLMFDFFLHRGFLIF